MSESANTLGQTANTLMQQLASSTITFQSYRDSMNSVIASSTDNSEFKDEDNAEELAYDRFEQNDYDDEKIVFGEEFTHEVKEDD